MSDNEDYDVTEIGGGDEEDNDVLDVDYENNADGDGDGDDENEEDLVINNEDDDDEDDEEDLNEPYGENDIDNDGIDGVNDYNSDDELDDDDTNYEKFDEEVRKNYVQTIHPELSFRSNDEIEALSQVKRDEKTGRIIKDEKHVTIPILSKFEFTRIIGSRISQLAQGAKPLVELKKKKHDLYLIAEQELIQKKLPFIIMRPIPNGKCEYWKLEDLEVII